MNETETPTWADDMTDWQIDKLGKAIDAQEFGHVFQVTRHGVVDGPAGIYAPEIYNDDTTDIAFEGDKWTALTGYTGQHGYNGAVMRSSEFIGGRLAEDIVEMSAEAEAEGRPLLWTVTTVEVLPDDDEEEPEPAGWAILYREI